MALAPHTIKCPRCGLVNPAGVSACMACGLPRSASGSAASGAASPPALGHSPPLPVPLPSPRAGGVPSVPPLVTPPSAGGTATISTLTRLLGRTVVNGVVIHVDPLYMVRPEFNWSGFLIKSGLAVLFFPVILSVAIATFMISTILSVVGLGRGGPGFFSNLASQVTGFFLTSKLFGPKADVPVRDVRLRDGVGNDHLVRIRGDFVAGNVNIGDDVTVEGFNRGGTLMFRRGYNNRTRSEIRVKRR